MKSASCPALNPFSVCYTHILVAMVLKQVTLQEYTYAKSELLCLLTYICDFLKNQNTRKSFFHKIIYGVLTQAGCHMPTKAALSLPFTREQEKIKQMLLS